MPRSALWVWPGYRFGRAGWDGGRAITGQGKAGT